MNVIALIGDISESRKVKNRDELQRKLRAALEEVNRDNPALLSPFTITLGDEFQAVYRNADRLFRDLWTILLKIFPQKVRFSLGMGILTTEINPRQAIGMDGPAFYHARSGIQELKKSGYLFRIVGDGIPHLNLLNQTLNLISHQSSNWSKNRLKILIGLLEGKNASALAQELSISRVAVYKNINAGALEVICELGSEISEILNRRLTDK